MHMQGARYGSGGGVEVIAFGAVAKPTPGPGQVLVRVRAAGLNRADLLQRRGHYPAPAGWPADIPGLEYAGEVESTGPDTTRWRTGDRVMGLVGGGAHAEYVVVHEAETLPVPAKLTLVEAAAIPEAFLTAWDALIHRARLVAGNRVLLHTVASGVGTAAVQLCRLLGIISIGTSRTAAKLERMPALGLSQSIDTSTGSFRAALTEPVDAVIDTLGGPAFGDNLAVLRPRGRLVILGFLLGNRTDADIAPLLRQRLEVIGTTMRNRTLDERIPLVREFEAKVLPHFESTTPAAGHTLVPVIDRVLPMMELARAHEVMEKNETVGKVVLEW